MSKKSRTTGAPAPAKRTPTARKYHSRHEREATINRAVWIISGVLAVLIVLILGAAVLVELVITPNQAVATVAGTPITTRDFQTRVRYERWRQGLELAYIYQNFGEQWLSGQGAPYAQQYQALQIPTILGQQVLEEMTNQLVIQKYADANGIKISQADIDAEVYRFFQYEPTPTTPTPTVTPSLTPTPLGLTDTDADLNAHTSAVDDAYAHPADAIAFPNRPADADARPNRAVPELPEEQPGLLHARGESCRNQRSRIAPDLRRASVSHESTQGHRWRAA
jgi:hypothetical protein